MIATAVKFNNTEFRKYLECLCEKKCNHLVFFEPWWSIPLHFRSFFFISPNSVPSKVSWVGGHLGDYHHNYKEMLSEYGYEIKTAVIKDAPLSTRHADLFIHATLR